MDELAVIEIYKELELKLGQLKKAKASPQEVQELETLLGDLKTQARSVGVDVEDNSVTGEIDNIDDRTELVAVSICSKKIQNLLKSFIQADQSLSAQYILDQIKILDAFYQKYFAEEKIEGIVLRVLNEKKLAFTDADLNGAYEKFQDGGLVIKEADYLSPKIKVIPFAEIQKEINEKLRSVPGIGSFFGSGIMIKVLKYPIQIKANLQASGDIAFFPTKLQTKVDTPVADDVLLSFFRNTNAFADLSNMKTSLTAVSAAKVIDLGFCKFALKLDLMKFASSIKDALANNDTAITPLAVSAQIKIDKDSLSWFNLNIVDCFDTNEVNSQIIISLQITASADLKKMLTDALVSQIEKEIREKTKDLTKNADKIAHDLIQKARSSEGKQAAKEFTKRADEIKAIVNQAKSTAGKEAAEKLVQEAGEKVGQTFLKKVGKSVLTKLIPGLNVVSTIYDIYQVGSYLWDWYNQPPTATDYIEMKVSATGAATSIKFGISSLSVKKEVYDQLATKYGLGEPLTKIFPAAMKVIITVSNCTGPAILSKSYDGELTLERCFGMSPLLNSDQVALEFFEWLNKQGLKLNDVKAK